MSESKTAEIKGENGSLALEVFRYENSNAEQTDDRNWLSARLVVNAGPFTGECNLSLSAAELLVLRESLSAVTKVLSGTAEFTNMEGEWTVCLMFERSGAACLHGSVTPNLSERNSLSYEIRTDPISIERFLSNLQSLSRSFPAYK